jgi:RNA recognition motif-containing protein
VKIYVGNLSFDTDEAGLRSAFAEFGDVDEVAVITDRDTGRPRGFAFVTMPDDAAARSAMEALNGKELDGRTLNVNEARAKTAGGPRGGGGGGRDRRRGGW